MKVPQYEERERNNGYCLDDNRNKKTLTDGKIKIKKTVHNSLYSDHNSIRGFIKLVKLILYRSHQVTRRT